MAEANETGETDGASPPATPPKSKKKLYMIIGAVVLLLAAGGGGAYYFLMSGDKEVAKADTKDAEAEQAHAEAEIPNYVDVPEMVVNLRTSDGQPRFLRIHFMLSAANAEAVPTITERLPAVRDAMQPFLRELRTEDLAGSAAVLRVKEELLRRARTQLPKDSLRDVLIQTMVQQ